MDEKISLVTFTDPMMGLSYECEPIFRKLETHFAGKIDFHFVMSLLVRDVYEFIDPDDLKFGKEVAIKNYNARLAEIYRTEENLGGLPINMDSFELFSVNEMSSKPLNLAYKTAQIVDAEKADRLLYNLRYATIADDALARNFKSRLQERLGREKISRRIQRRPRGKKFADRLKYLSKARNSFATKLSDSIQIAGRARSKSARLQNFCKNIFRFERRENQSRSSAKKYRNATRLNRKAPADFVD